MQQSSDGTEKNAAILRQEIERLSQAHCIYDQHSSVQLVSSINYCEFWKHAGDVASMFKTFALGPEERERLWAIYDRVCKETRTLQHESLESSRKNSSVIEATLESAQNQENNREGIARAYDLLRSAREMLLNEQLLFPEGRNCWSRYNAIYRTVYSRCLELQAKSAAVAKSCLEECVNYAAHGDQEHAHQKIRLAHKVLNELWLQPGYRQQARRQLEEAWENASSRAKEYDTDNGEKVDAEIARRRRRRHITSQRGLAMRQRYFDLKRRHR